MHEVEIWIDVVIRGGGRNETACTLFGNHTIPMRPAVGEQLCFFQAKGSYLEYTLISPIGPAESSSVSVSIEEIRHYAVRSNSNVVFKTSLRCGEIAVASEEDARIVCSLMKPLKFELDPYGVNILEGKG
jgi:hypothetical protein